MWYIIPISHRRRGHGGRGAFTVHPCVYDEAEAHQRVAEFVLQGKLDAGLWYDMERLCPLSEISAAYAALRNRQALKVLIQLHP